MILLLPTNSSDNEHYDECYYTAVHMDKEIFKCLSARVGAAVRLKKAFKDLVRQSYWDEVSLHDLSDDQIKKIKEECLFIMLGDIIALGEGSSIPEESWVRAGCDQVCIRPANCKKHSYVHWIVYDHYCGIRLESASLTFEALSRLMMLKSLKMPGVKSNVRAGKKRTRR